MQKNERSFIQTFSLRIKFRIDIIKSKFERSFEMLEYLHPNSSFVMPFRSPKALIVLEQWTMLLPINLIQCIKFDFSFIPSQPIPLLILYRPIPTPHPLATPSTKPTLLLNLNPSPIPTPFSILTPSSIPYYAPTCPLFLALPQLLSLTMPLLLSLTMPLLVPFS